MSGDDCFFVSATTILEKYSVKQPRVLLVEDAPTDGRQLVRELVSRNLDVTLECDGLGAIRKVHEAREPFDLVCLDLQLDVLETRYTSNVLRIIGYSGPIITLSPCNDPDSCVKCFSAGCNECVSRTTAPDDLLRILDDLTHKEIASKTPQTTTAASSLIFG